MTNSEIIEVVTAESGGAKIQVREKQRPDIMWFDCMLTPSWNFDRHDYRVKPEPPKPRELFGVLYGNETELVGGLFAAEHSARASYPHARVFKIQIPD